MDTCEPLPPEASPYSTIFQANTILRPSCRLDGKNLLFSYSFSARPEREGGCASAGNHGPFISALMRQWAVRLALIYLCVIMLTLGAEWGPRFFQPITLIIIRLDTVLVLRIIRALLFGGTHLVIKIYHQCNNTSAEKFISEENLWNLYSLCVNGCGIWISFQVLVSLL